MQPLAQSRRISICIQQTYHRIQKRNHVTISLCCRLITQLDKVIPPLTTLVRSRTKYRKCVTGDRLEQTRINASRLDSCGNAFPGLAVNTLQVSPKLREVIAEER